MILPACQGEPADEVVGNATGEPAIARPGLPGNEASSEPQADANASGEELGTLPPADAPLRFVERWAADERLCRATALRFTELELRTPAGSVCRFSDVRNVPGGYDISARCTAEAPERDDVLKLRFAESARAMLFESESIADAELVYCGA